MESTIGISKGSGNIQKILWRLFWLYLVGRLLYILPAYAEHVTEKFAKVTGNIAEGIENLERIQISLDAISDKDIENEIFPAVIEPSVPETPEVEENNRQVSPSPLSTYGEIKCLRRGTHCPYVLPE